MKLEFRAFDGPSDWGWICQKVAMIRCQDTSGITVVDTETNTTVAMFVTDHWMPNSVQIHVAIGEHEVMRVHHEQMINEVFDYIFNVRDKRFIYAWMVSSNKEAKSFAERLGFTEMARLPEAYDDENDFLMMGVDREDCGHMYTPLHTTNYELDLKAGGA